MRPKPSLKIGTANTNCWNSLGLFRDYGLNYYFLNKTFFKLKFSASVLKKEFLETSQNFNSIKTDRKNGNKNCLNELNEFKFCEVSQNSIFRTDAESFSFLPRKKFYS